MNKVYIVTSGEYSDYHIDAVFASREKAEAYIKIKDKAKWEEYEHDEWDVQTSKYGIEEWNLGDEYVNTAYWEISGSIYTSLNFEERSIDVYACDQTGVDAHKRSNISNSVKIGSHTNYYGHCYQITAKYFIPRNRFSNAEEVKARYKKVMRDLLAKVKYMVQVDGMTLKEAENAINEQIKEI